MVADSLMREPRAAAPVQRPRSRLAVRMSFLTLGSGLGAVLVPKCPLCFAAYLAPFGVTAGAASVGLALVRPLWGVLAVLALGLILVRNWRRVSSQGRLWGAARSLRGGR